MSEHLKKSLQPKRQRRPQVWCLSKEDWDKMAACLMEAKRLFKLAQEVTDVEWSEWTDEFSAEQGFPSIIYHDKPVIIRPPELPLQR